MVFALSWVLLISQIIERFMALLQSIFFEEDLSPGP